MRCVIRHTFKQTSNQHWFLTCVHTVLRAYIVHFISFCCALNETVLSALMSLGQGEKDEASRGGGEGDERKRKESEMGVNLGRLEVVSTIALFKISKL